MVEDEEDRQQHQAAQMADVRSEQNINRVTNQGGEAVEVDEEESSIACRVCFDCDGELVSPCQCRGSQEYIHLHCLRQVSRSI